jgi:hypothetical protein
VLGSAFCKIAVYLGVIFFNSSCSSSSAAALAAAAANYLRLLGFNLFSVGTELVSFNSSTEEASLAFKF